MPQFLVRVCKYRGLGCGPVSDPLESPGQPQPATHFLLQLWTAVVVPGRGRSWRLSGDWTPPPPHPQETQNPGPAGWRVGASTKKASVQPGWAAHRILGEAARAGFRPRSASCGGRRNARSSCPARPVRPTVAPSPVFSWAWGTDADFLTVVPDVMCLEPGSHQKDPWETAFSSKASVRKPGPGVWV